MESERDIRDFSRAYLDARSLDEFYRTFYPRPSGPLESPWGAVSILTKGEIRSALLAYHLKRKWGILVPSMVIDDYLRLVVSERGRGREQGIKAQMGIEKRKRGFMERLFGFRKHDGESP